MINDSPFGAGSLTVAAGGFTATEHPHWVIQKKIVDLSGLMNPGWFDAYRYYDEDTVYKDCIPQPNTDYSVKYNPEELRKILDRLREQFPSDVFRMVMRVEMQHALDF